MRIIVFTGPKTSGKNTAANFLLARNGLLRQTIFEEHNFADSLKNACSAIFGFSPAEMNTMPFKEQPLDRWPCGIPREHLIKVAKMFRSFYGGDIFVERWESVIKLSKAQCIVVTDLRHLEELDKLKEMKAKIIYVQNDEAERKLVEAREAGDVAALDVSEASYELMRLEAHAIIMNNGSIDELHDQVSAITKDLLGEWALWGDQTAPINV